VSEPELTEVPVPPLLVGVRVDRAVAMLAGVSRATAAALIADGRVLVDGVAPATGRFVLQAGSRLTIALPEEAETGLQPEPEVAFAVVHVDDDVVVVDKPAGLVVHPGAGRRHGTLVAGLLARFPDLGALADAGICPPERPGIVHRLDKGTSGLLAVARTEVAYHSLVAQLADRSMQRRYLALVHGTVDDDRGEIDAPVGRSTRTPTKMAVTAAGRDARTSYIVRARLVRPQPCTLVELRLHSGRTHQIRVHMAAIGHPVVGDARYGTSEPSLGAGRFFLHAGALSFAHPATGAAQSFVAVLPEDLATYLSRLVDADDVGVEGQGGQSLFLGPPDAPDADPESLGR
jgi:23S rRNA pseudouridine1911/1915/1917 synthase